MELLHFLKVCFNELMIKLKYFVDSPQGGVQKGAWRDWE